MISDRSTVAAALALLASFVLASLDTASASAAGPPGIVNLTRGELLRGIGGSIGGDTYCRRSVNRVDCSTDPRQLIGARDFATDGRYAYIATTGLDDIGECFDKECLNTPVHDNSSRLIAFDMMHPTSEPVTLSYCGPWIAVEYDDSRAQVVAMRRVNLQTDEHGTHYATEIVAFDVKNVKAASDAKSMNCYNVVPESTGKDTCACAKGFDPDNLNGRVIGRAGLLKDGILPAATMTILGDSVLVGDQNQYCVLSYPLDGSAGSTTKGVPVAGTCGKSCGEQGCADIGSKPVPAGKKLGDGTRGHGNDLVYTMFTTPDGNLLLQDMNTETINYGAYPKAETQYITAPVDPKVSSVYEVPVIDPASGDLLLHERFSQSGQLLKPTKNGGYGNAKVVINGEDLTGYYNEKSIENTTTLDHVKVVPFRWRFVSGNDDSKTQVLALVKIALSAGSGYIDGFLVKYEI